MSKQENGFTIVELMIAITVLSVMLLLAAMGITRIGQSYFRGIIQANTQQTARTILQDVAQTVEFNGEVDILSTSDTLTPASYPPTGLPVNAICLGSNRYVFAQNFVQNDTATNISTRQSKHALWRDVISDTTKCTPLDIGQSTPVALSTTTPAQQAGTNGKELLGSKMRIVKFSVASVPTNANLVQVSITVLYGDDDVFDVPGGVWANATCKPSSLGIGYSFCARSDLSTVVGKRKR